MMGKSFAQIQPWFFRVCLFTFERRPVSIALSRVNER